MDDEEAIAEAIRVPAEPRNDAAVATTQEHLGNAYDPKAQRDHYVYGRTSRVVLPHHSAALSRSSEDYAPRGQKYEREAIADWLESKSTDPMTGGRGGHGVCGGGRGERLAS